MHLDLVVMADQLLGQGGGGGALLRDYRKGNWTLQETMILIEAKKMDDERRMKKQLSGGENMQIVSTSSSSSNKPTELRWKWVEDYCWRKGCFRSQNQCNDKWDNLMRDYKRVRDYEKTRLLSISNKDGGHGNINEEEEAGGGCYWKIEKSERKGKNLPSNMLQQIYEALVEVVERKGSTSLSLAQQQQQPQPLTGGGYHVNVVELRPPLISVVPAPILQELLPPPPPPLPPSTAAMSEPLPPATATMHCTDGSSGSDTTRSGGKKRRRRTSTSTSSSSEDAISKGASMIAQAIEACGETRRKQVNDLHERRLESNSQGFHALVHAINNLANSILALASNNNNSNNLPK